jgi:hypothetical protein
MSNTDRVQTVYQACGEQNIAPGHGRRTKAEAPAFFPAIYKTDRSTEDTAHVAELLTP